MNTKKRFLLLYIISIYLNVFSSLTIYYDTVTHQNQRPYQEDRFSFSNLSDGQLFGIFDGHSGDKTSSYLQDNLHLHFNECLRNSRNIHSAFDCAFLKAEKHVIDHYNDGSTAVVIYIDKDNILHCAWVGDSRGVVEKDGKVAFATNDHKPNRSDEKKRIEDAGGNIEYYGVWRINGLAVSRSIGDKSCKEDKNQIIATPEYAQYPLTKNNHCIILASDGLWDVMSNEKVVSIVNKKLKNKHTLKEIAQLLCKKAIKLASNDNITICILYCDWNNTTHFSDGYAQKIDNKKSAIGRFWNWLWGK